MDLLVSDSHFLAPLTHSLAGDSLSLPCSRVASKRTHNEEAYDERHRVRRPSSVREEIYTDQFEG